MSTRVPRLRTPACTNNCLQATEIEAALKRQGALGFPINSAQSIRCLARVECTGRVRVGSERKGRASGQGL